MRSLTESNDRLRRFMRRTLFRMRLPLSLFIILILVSCAASYVVFYSAAAAHLRGDYFRLETKYLDIDFPRNWVAMSWEEKNSSGTKYGILLAPSNLRAAMLITVYDEDATKAYLEQYHVTDPSSVTVFELKRLYNWTLEKSGNATLQFVENGTIPLFGYMAKYSTAIIREGFVDDRGARYNWTWTFMSAMDGKIFQAAYHGVGEDYNLTANSFQSILNATRAKAG